MFGNIISLCLSFHGHLLTKQSLEKYNVMECFHEVNLWSIPVRFCMSRAICSSMSDPITPEKDEKIQTSFRGSNILTHVKLTGKKFANIMEGKGQGYWV